MWLEIGCKRRVSPLRRDRYQKPSDWWYFEARWPTSISGRWSAGSSCSVSRRCCSSGSLDSIFASLEVQLRCELSLQLLESYYQLYVLVVVVEKMEYFYTSHGKRDFKTSVINSSPILSDLINRALDCSTFFDWGKLPSEADDIHSPLIAHNHSCAVCLLVNSIPLL